MNRKVYDFKERCAKLLGIKNHEDLVAIVIKANWSSLIISDVPLKLDHSFGSQCYFTWSSCRSINPTLPLEGGELVDGEPFGLLGYVCLVER